MKLLAIVATVVALIFALAFSPFTTPLSAFWGTGVMYAQWGMFGGAWVDGIGISPRYGSAADQTGWRDGCFTDLTVSGFMPPDYLFGSWVEPTTFDEAVIAELVLRQAGQFWQGDTHVYHFAIQLAAGIPPPGNNPDVPAALAAARAAVATLNGNYGVYGPKVSFFTPSQGYYPKRVFLVGCSA